MLGSPSGEAALDDRRRPAPAAVWESTIASDHGRRDYRLRRILVAVDMLGLTLALATAFAVVGVRNLADLAWLAPALPVWVLLFAAYGLYRRDMKRISQDVLDDLPWLFHAFVIGTLLLWVYFRLIPAERQLAFPELAVFGFVGISAVLGFRWLARRVSNHLLGPERVLLVGEAPVTNALVRKIETHPEYALEPVGVVTRDGVSTVASELPVVAALDEAEIANAIDEHDVERVIVAQEEVDDSLMLELLASCGRGQVKIGVLPRHVEAMGPSVEVDDIEGVTILGLNPLVLPRSSRLLKRAMDVVGAGIGLFLAVPLCGVIAVAIKLDSRGPVLFRQTRIGRRGESFTLPKFRTMRVGAEEETARLRERSDDPNWLKLDHDPRITRVGRFLRLASLDELPQLWTVLTGRMSLVGPRPLIGEENERVLNWARVRLDLAPGITGLWQVLGRTSIPFDEMVKLDYVYVSNWSLWTDIKLLLRTLPAVFLRRGAN